MKETNAKLAEMGLSIAVESMEFFTIGQGRPSNRIHQLPFRWVPNDPRRLADGENITYIVDPSWGSATASGVSQAATETAIDNALSTWAAQQALKKVTLVKRPFPGTDVTIYDSPLVSGFGACVGGGLGNFTAADIVIAGWYPANCFAFGTLAFSVSFIFLDSPGGPPSDINGDNYLDTALNEVYFNDAWGNPALTDGRQNFPWGIDVDLPGIDVQTVALHETGHSLQLGHFGPPPAAVLNPVYAGRRISPLPADLAGMNTVWASWPNP